MQSRIGALIGVLAWQLLLPSSVTAVQVAYTGEMTAQTGPVDPNQPPIAGPGAGTVEIDDGDLTGGAIMIAAGASGSGGSYVDLGTNFFNTGSQTFATPTMNPGGAVPVFIKSGAITVGNDAGSFAPSGFGSSFGGLMRQVGRQQLFVATWPDGGGLLTLAVPLGAVGGSPGETRTATALMGLVAVTLGGSPWRTGMLTLSETRGMEVTTLTATGFDNRGVDPNGAVTGSIQLVTPIYIEVGGSVGAQAEDFQVGIATLRLDFAPEPGVGLLLLAAAPVALAAGLLRRRP